MNIVKFSGTHAADIPTQLRELADRVEARAFGYVHNVAYVLDRGDKEVDIGLMGAADSPGAEAYYLLGLGMRTLEEK